ncbi:FAD-binding oxidoreductase [Micromonospora halophytica]|uniref:FAD-binding oxidoreductase n=1 Tax=Micromonospora halophytica TaxID=47864 RepID=UPI001B8D5442|nr:FAD-binding protein [Micromonospora halophytica]
MTTSTEDSSTAGPVTIVPGDSRYVEVTSAANGRFRCRPRQVRVVGSTAQVVQAVQDAVDAGARVVARSGGHCLEDFVDSPETEFLIDLSELKAVGYDAGRRAFFVEPGALLGDVYRTLLKGWGVTIPAGLEAGVGVGGHVPGGGYGPLTRRYGSVVDHLEAVEVVVVDRSGTAGAVVASRDPADPARELWWAHTGGGGGTFGIVTRYWFRTPGAVGPDPAGLLPTPPAEVLDSLVLWSWPDLTRESFGRLLRNHGRWHELNSGPDSRFTSLFSILTVLRRESGMVGLTTQVDAGRPDAAEMLDAYLAALNEGVGVPYTHDVQTRPWLRSMLHPRMSGNVWGLRAKCKAAYLRRRYTEAQTDVIYRRLTSEDYRNPTAGVILAAYGGMAAAVPPDATATAQRDSVLKAFYLDNWTDAAQDDEHITWIREFYRELYADTGGVPVPGDDSDGSYINYPDTDLADPRWNTSGTPWYTLYHKDNYPRLQQVKARWDPLDVFRHGLSVRLPD